MQVTFRQFLITILVIIGFALLQTLALIALVHTSFWMLLINSLLYSSACGLLIFPLLNVARFSRLEALSPTLQTINYSMYISIATSVAVGIAYLAELLIYGTEQAQHFLPVLPFRALMSGSVFTGILLCIKATTKEAHFSPEKEEKSEKVTNPDQPYIQRIALRTGSKINVVSTEDVLYLLADGDYVQVVTAQGRFLKEQTMKSFSEQLSPEQFVRVHRSTIVNIEAISRIERYEKSTQQLRLKNSDTVKVSQQGYKVLRQQLGL